MNEEVLKFVTEAERRIPVAGKYDVIVVGGGIAGISAALAARREGSSVLLLERTFLLGGLATSGLITIYLPLCDGQGNQVSYGLAEELLRLSIRHGSECGDISAWLCKDGDCEKRKNVRYQVQFNANLAALLFEQALNNEGVEINYGSMVCSVLTNGSTIKGVVTESKTGREVYEAKAFVDASGDADLSKLSNAKTALFKQGNIVAGWYYAIENHKHILKQLGFADIPDKYKTYNQMKDNKRKRYTGITSNELNSLTFFSHNEILQDFIKGGGVNEEHVLCTIPTIPQVRMTRRICGKYTLDDTEYNKRFEDSIGIISDWRKSGFVYEIPYRTLYGEYTNLFSCGRCISVTDSMWDITRVIPACAVTGQAAGTAAASFDVGKSTVDVLKLQNRLVSAGVVLHIDEVYQRGIKE